MSDGSRFDELGRFQFERLCRELAALELGIGRSEWRTAGGGAVASALEGAVVPATGRCLAGPALVVSTWRRDRLDATAAEAVPRVVARILAAEPAPPRSLLVLTNVPIAAADVARPDGVAVEILGPHELAELIRSRARLRLVLPSLLASFDEAELLPVGARERSTADFGAALELVRVFHPTRAYAATLAVLERFGFAVLTGPPEMGKTAIARMLGLALLSDGWELHECVRPEELWQRYDRERAQVFVADDAFGSTEYRPDSAERWAVELERALRAMDGRHRLLWTSRPAPLKAGLRRIHREHGVERFPRPAEVQVDAADLDVEEKALILFRHAKAAQLPAAAVEAIQMHGWDIVGDVHFTPERMRRFVRSRLLARGALVDLDAARVAGLVQAEVQEPTAAMAESFRALGDEYRAVLVGLLDVPPGPAAEREVAASVRRHSPAGHVRHPAELLDRLTDHFVRVRADGAVTWVHPSWRDLVIDELADSVEARRRFLGACGIDGLLLAVSTAGGGAGTRSLPLLQHDDDWDAAGGTLFRLAASLDEPATTRLLIALADAIATVGEPRHPELDALAAYALELLARLWDEAHGPIPLGLLARWLELRAALPAAPELPALGATWVEVRPPTSAAASAASARAFADWLTFVELLGEHAPDELDRFSSGRQREAIAVDFVEAAVAAEPDVARDLLWLLRRLVFAVPAVAAAAQRAILEVLQSPAAATESDTYAPRPISPELERLLEVRTPSPGLRDRLLVQEVLRDL